MNLEHPAQNNKWMDMELITLTIKENIQVAVISIVWRSRSLEKVLEAVQPTVAIPAKPIV